MLDHAREALEMVHGRSRLDLDTDRMLGPEKGVRDHFPAHLGDIAALFALLRLNVLNHAKPSSTSADWSYT